jgi:hypothetical protein
MKIQNNKAQHNAENCYAECRFGSVSFMLGAIILNVVMLKFMALLGDLGPMSQNYFVHNLQIFEISLSV